MKVHFLDVGQGDSIILEWERDGKRKCGIIDSKNDGGYVQTILFLEKFKPDRIDFIILTHPHSDHFSGLISLIEYLLKNGISIDAYYTTATISPNRIAMSMKGKVGTNEVRTLFKKLYEFNLNGQLQTYFLQELPTDFNLSHEWKLKVMSPSVKELNDYGKLANYDLIHQEEEPDNEPMGNLLSTCLAIFNDNIYFLLTADLLSGSFQRIDNNYKDFFRSRRLALGQIAHHGSVKNYKSGFWKSKFVDNTYQPLVISVGPNIYHHPSEEVRINVQRLGFDLYTTEEYSKTTAIASDTRSLLDVFTTASSTDYLKKTLSFSFKNNEAEIIN